MSEMNEQAVVACYGPVIVPNSRLCGYDMVPPPLVCPVYTTPAHFETLEPYRIQTGLDAWVVPGFGTTVLDCDAQHVLNKLLTSYPVRRAGEVCVMAA